MIEVPEILPEIIVTAVKISSLFVFNFWLKTSLNHTVYVFQIYTLPKIKFG